MSLPASTSQSVSVYDSEPGEAEAAEAAAGALCCSEGEDEKLSSANVFKGGESGGGWVSHQACIRPRYVESQKRPPGVTPNR